MEGALSVTADELKKKGIKPKRSSEVDGKGKKNTFQTLARIVASNGSLVAEIPKLPTCTSELTTYDHMRIAMEHAALATSCLVRLGCAWTPTLADTHNLAPIRLNLEDLMNHLFYAIELFDRKKGQS